MTNYTKTNNTQSLCTLILLLSFALTFLSCNEKPVIEVIEEVRPQQVEMVTSHGTMIIKLYDETPLHRDNFINLAKNKAFDSLLFHRVIQKFMIQGGDPDSRKANALDTLGDGDAPYLVPAEFRPELFHKKGVLAAARDNNFARSSSAMQFYIVHGKVFDDSTLAKAEVRINKNLAVEFYKEKDRSHPLLLAMNSAMDNNNMTNYFSLKDSIWNLAQTESNFATYRIPDHQRSVYKTAGGVPHLDQNYTVFGEVIKGIEIIDSIANVETNELDRPTTDVRIISVRVLTE